MPKRKDALLIAAVLVVAGVLLLVSRLMPEATLEGKTADIALAPDAVEYLDATADPTAEPTEAPAAQATAEPTEAPAKAEAEAKAEAPAAMVGPMPPPKAAEVKGHVVITLGNRQYGDPIPMDREKVITVKQENGHINKVHITPEKVYMEFSSCENQDCVGQGEITMDNYETRILSTFVICLPNNVTVEMVPVK